MRTHGCTFAYFAYFAYSALEAVSLLPLWTGLVIANLATAVMRASHAATSLMPFSKFWEALFSPSRKGSVAIDCSRPDAFDKKLLCDAIETASACSLGYMLTLTSSYTTFWDSLAVSMRLDTAAWAATARDCVTGAETYLALVDLVTQYRTALECLVSRYSSDDVRLVGRDPSLGILFYANFDSKELTVGFAGTSRVLDVFLDLFLWPVYDEQLQCRVHGGFRRKALWSLPVVRDMLCQTIPQGERWSLVLCGHSLGAAVALLVTEYMRLDAQLAKKLKKIDLRLMAAPAVFWRGYPRASSPLGSEIFVRRFAMIHELDVTDTSLQLLGFCGNRLLTLVVGQDGQLLVHSAGCSPGKTLPSAFFVLYHLPGNSLLDLTRAVGAEALADCLRRAEPTCSSSELSNWLQKGRLDPPASL